MGTKIIFVIYEKTVLLLLSSIFCFVNLGIAQPPIAGFQPKRPTIDKLYYNDRATTGEIEAGPLEVQFFFLSDSTHLVLWTADRDVAYYDKLDFTTISSPRNIVYNWHTGLPVAMCPSTVDYTDRYSKAWQQYEVRMQYCKNPLELFCKPGELPEVDKKLNNYYHGFTKLGKNQWATTHHKSDSRYSVANAEIGYYNSNGNMGSTEKKLEFPSAIQYSKPAICPGLPVCAVLNQTDIISYEDHMMRGRIDIMNIETGEKITSLVNWREYQQYQDVENKYLADSIASVRSKEQMNNVIVGIRSEGWTIEKIKYGMEPNEDIYIGGDKWGIWDFTPAPNRIYSFIALSTTSDLTSWPVADRQSDKTVGMRGKYFQKENLDNLKETPLRYVLSHALYNSKPNDPVFFGTAFSCRGAKNECLSKEMADSTKLCRLLISHEKPATNEITIKAIDETLKILEVQATYIAAVKQIKQNEANWAAEEKLQKQKEQEEIRKAKEAEKNALTAKQVFAEYKVKKPKMQTVRKEIYDILIPAGNVYKLGTDFPADEKRIILVVVKGENHYVQMSAAIEGIDDYVDFDAKDLLTKVSVGGLSTTKTSFTGPLDYLNISSKENEDIKVSIMVLTQKDVAGKLAFDKQIEKLNASKSEAKEKRNLAHLRENTENDDRVKKIRAAFEQFASKMTSLYNNANQNGENWTLSKQIEEFNKARNLVGELKSNVDRNIPSGFLSGNPSADSYKKWFTNAMTYFNDINEKLTKLGDEIEDRKARNALYAAKPLFYSSFYLPLQDMRDLAEKFNSFLNSDNPK